jgi:hypothetical protein
MAPQYVGAKLEPQAGPIRRQAAMALPGRIA